MKGQTSGGDWIEGTEIPERRRMTASGKISRKDFWQEAYLCVREYNLQDRLHPFHQEFSLHGKNFPHDIFFLPP